MDGRYDDRDPKLVRLADGTVLLSYFVIDWSTKARHGRHTVTGTYVRRSTDDGRTWGPAFPVGTMMPGTRDDRGRIGWACSHGPWPSCRTANC